jgi:alpha-glucosidase
MDREFKVLVLDPASFTHVYGLGEQFPEEATPDGDWNGRIRAGGDFGNVQEGTAFGSVGNDQFPIAYFLGPESTCYGMFLDSGYKQVWYLQEGAWSAATGGEALRFYFLAGPDLPDLRQDYLELTGRPPVPPKKAFGLWVSEYGYDDWTELEDKLRTLRENHFPVDGFVLDLQWYGGIQENDDTQMGSLTWDETNFPNPEEKIAYLRDEEGIGLVHIEQSYVGKNLPEHATLTEKGYLVKECETCDPIYLTANPWWGMGGMIDWTDAEVREFWHDWKRGPLLSAGLMGHWTDLGEPEAYSENGWYAGVVVDDTTLHEHAAVHNLYNLLWVQGIYEGYARNEEMQRPFILSRSGTSGIQRYGAAMWSGDISSSLDSLTAHLNVQMHMALSGVDYYGSDIGGFWRQGGDLTQLYTLWLANGMAFDVPGRAHTFNLSNTNETAPDRVGDLESNLVSVRQRYELVPYLYSLAHRAYLYGEPVVPPLVYYYQADPNVREMGSEKLLGRDLLVATASTFNQFDRTVYLPAGTWFDYHAGQRYESTGQEFGPFPLYPEGILQLPTFARAGAIIPTMYVDDQTMNVFGRRLDGTTRDELIVRVYAGAEPTAFTLYEDDGTTIAYQQGEVRTTLLAQQQTGAEVVVTIAAASGTYAGAPAQRDNVVQLYVDGFEAGGVTLNGTALPQLDSPAAFDTAASGWCNAGPNLILSKSGELDVGQEKAFRFTLAAPVLPTAGPLADPLPIYWPTTGWQRATPEQVGMDAPTLARAVDYLARQDILLHRWLLIRQGYLIVDASFTRELPAEPFARESATTAFLSTLVGIAIDRGDIPSVDEPVVNFFPGRTIANIDARKEAMTLEDLLTMRSGLDCQPVGTMVEMQSSADWVQHILDLPMATDPGTTFNPCEVNAHLVTAILQQATGLQAIDYAQERLFAPLGIADVDWAADPQGVNQGWTGLQMDAADTAKLGLLYLRGGEWDGRQVVSAAWVADATQWQVTLDQQGGYGYLWLTNPQGYLAYAPLSQWLIVVPAADMVLVPTGGLLEENGFQIHVLASSFLTPALRSNTPLPENPAGAAQLQASIAAVSYVVTPQPVQPLPDIAREISGQRYTMEGEEFGWETVSLSFPGGAEAIFSLRAEGEELALPVGLDGIQRVYVQPTPVGPVLVACVGSWESADTFVLDLVQYMSVGQARVTMRMTFQGDGVDMTLSVEEGTVTIHGEK